MNAESARASQHPTVVRRDAPERIRAALDEGFWVLEPTATGWLLRILDDHTGALGAPVHSGCAGGDLGAAVDWADSLVDVEQWDCFDDHGSMIDDLYTLFLAIRRRPYASRPLVVRTEPDIDAARTLVTIRELWPDGHHGAPLHTRELDSFGTLEDAVNWATDRYNVTTGWTRAADGGYRQAV